jgi:hypothetical protein
LLLLSSVTELLPTYKNIWFPFILLIHFASYLGDRSSRKHRGNLEIVWRQKNLPVISTILIRSKFFERCNCNEFIGNPEAFKDTAKRASTKRT